MKTIALITSFVLLSFNVGFAQKNETFEVPFTMDRNLMLIKAEVNGKKELSFIYDTGTTGLVLSETLVNELKLKVTGTTLTQSPNSALPDKVNTVAVPIIKLNGFEVKNLEGVVVPPQQIFSPNASGIIGLSAFKGNLVTIDFKSSKLILKKGALDSKDKSVVKVDFSRAPEAYVKVNGEDMLAVFDCGGPSEMSFPMEWKSKLKLKSEPVLFAKARTPGGEVEVYRAELVGTVSFGLVEMKDPQITLVTGGFGAINFGNPFFQKHTTTLDMTNQLMRFDAISPSQRTEKTPLSKENSSINNSTPKLPFNEFLYKTLNEKGIVYIKANVEKLASQAGLPYDDRFLNFFGYDFLTGNRKEAAISLFKLNTELFPKVANTHDSLAEGYLSVGDKVNALKCYKAVLQLTPDDKKTKDIIAKLEKEK